MLRRFEHPLALVPSLKLHRFGAHDPTFRLDAQTARWAQHTPEGPGLLEIRAHDPFRFTVQGHGPGGTFLKAHADGLLGADDRPEAFRPDHPILKRVQARLRGFRLASTPTVFEVFVRVVLQQRVSWREAARSFRSLVRRFGEPMPGAPDVWLMPPPRVWRSLSLETYRAFEVDGQRARALKAGATSVRRLEEIKDMAWDDANARLRAFPGVGVWTAQYVLGFARGYADAVPEQDYDLPRLVGVALAGEERADDARMLELLEPFRGHRFRAIRLLMQSGIPTPRFGPRRPSSSFRRRAAPLFSPRRRS